MQRLCHMRWTLSVGAICISLFFGAARAWAQAGEAATPQLDEKPATVAWVTAGLFLAAFLVVAFKNPKRSHMG